LLLQARHVNSEVPAGVPVQLDGQLEALALFDELSFYGLYLYN
jgi:hypothetical protein